MPTHKSLSDLLRRLEETLLQPGIRHSRIDLERLLDEDFVEFGSTGEVYNRQEIIAALAEENPVARSLTDFRAVLLAPDVALVTYRAAQIRPTGEAFRHSLRSSVWREAAGQWRLVFHQGTLSPGA